MEKQLRERSNEMLDPSTRNLIQVDSRLFDQHNWVRHPHFVQGLLNETAHNADWLSLSALAAYYLSLSSANFQINPPTRKTPCDVFLVLGHALNADATPKPELVARLEMALRVSKSHPAAKLVVSGGGQAMGVKEAEMMKRWLTARGVAEERVLVEFRSRDTVENITMSTALLAQKDVKKLCLITGSQHIKRATHLLSLHLANIDTKINASYLASVAPGKDHASREELAKERFLLFKDLGRILGVWQYRGWRPQPMPS
jgi:uncharacterized SAM-binding protein YcdF (DUF218 family)